MNRRTRAVVACGAIALACGALVVTGLRHGASASTAPREPRTARVSSDLQQPVDRVPIATRSSRTDQTEAPSTRRPPVAPRAARSPASSESGSDEAALMLQLRDSQGNDPARAIELAREGNRRFRESPDAPERASILIHALADQGLASEARGEAEAMVNRYPDSAWVSEVERFTGARRHRDVQLGPHGKLRYAP